MGWRDWLRSAPAEPPEPSIVPLRTIEGNPQSIPEAPRSFARRQRLFEYCKKVLVSHPLASDRLFGRPLGDGYGMEELVEIVRPVFDREPSMIQWTALRGALADLYQCGETAWPAFSESVGIELVKDHFTGEPSWTIAKPPEGFAGRKIDAALGVHASIMIKVARYDRIMNWSITDVIDGRVWAETGAGLIFTDAMALDMIAWASIVLNRCQSRGLLPPILHEPPLPSMLEKPGWYADPIFPMNNERFYDGSDWTSRCRIHADGSVSHTDLPITAAG